VTASCRASPAFKFLEQRPRVARVVMAWRPQMLPSPGSAFQASERVRKWLLDVEREIEHSEACQQADQLILKPNPEQSGEQSICRLCMGVLLTWLTAGSLGTQPARKRPSSREISSRRQHPQNRNTGYATEDGIHHEESADRNGAYDPSNQYVRRPRHRTRGDRYEFKEISQQPAKRKHSKKITKTNPHTAMNGSFHAPNVLATRLTLRSTGPGMLSKSRSSGGGLFNGVPDLTFPETTSLGRRAGDKRAGLRKDSPQSHQKQSRSHSQRGQEISRFFSMSASPHDGRRSIPKHCGRDSLVTWSTSPPQKPTTTTNRESSARAYDSWPQSASPGEEGDGSVLNPIDPISSVSNQFLNELTANMLLKGVPDFARRNHRHSLEDSKRFGQRKKTDVGVYPGTVSGDDFEKIPTGTGTGTADRSPGQNEVRAWVQGMRQVPESGYASVPAMQGLPSGLNHERVTSLTMHPTKLQERQHMLVSNSIPENQVGSTFARQEELCRTYVNDVHLIAASRSIEPEKRSTMPQHPHPIGDVDSTSMVRRGDRFILGQDLEFAVVMSDLPGKMYDPGQQPSSGDSEHGTDDQAGIPRALDEMQPLLCDYDDFDRALLREGNEPVSPDGLGHRTNDGFWAPDCDLSVTCGPKGHAPEAFHDRSDFPERSHHVVVDPGEGTEGFAGFTRRQILY
jgi:hypothetical protein